MAGASLRADGRIDDRDIRRILKRLERAGGDMAAAFRDIGEYLLISHRERWERQEAPDGAPWAPLDPKYQRRKKKNRDKTLVLEGNLRDLLRYDAGSDGLEFGTDRIYGAIHHYGGAGAGRPDIPERPFLGLSEADRREVLGILRDHLERVKRA